MKKTTKSNPKIPSYEPDVIENDLCILLPKEWLASEAKTSWYDHKGTENQSICNIMGSCLQFRCPPPSKSREYETKV